MSRTSTDRKAIAQEIQDVLQEASGLSYVHDDDILIIAHSGLVFLPIRLTVRSHIWLRIVLLPITHTLAAVDGVGQKRRDGIAQVWAVGWLSAADNPEAILVGNTRNKTERIGLWDALEDVETALDENNLDELVHRICLESDLTPQILHDADSGQWGCAIGLQFRYYMGD